MEVELQELWPADITADPMVQQRADGLDAYWVDELARILEDGGQFTTPVIVYDDGEKKWLAGGFHRHEAATKAKRLLVAEVRQGTRRDAIIFAIGDNADHGKCRTKRDIRRAIVTAMADAELSLLSDRGLSAYIKCDSSYISRIRREITGAAPDPVKQRAAKASHEAVAKHKELTRPAREDREERQGEEADIITFPTVSHADQTPQTIRKPFKVAVDTHLKGYRDHAFRLVPDRLVPKFVEWDEEDGDSDDRPAYVCVNCNALGIGYAGKTCEICNGNGCITFGEAKNLPTLLMEAFKEGPDKERSRIDEAMSTRAEYEELMRTLRKVNRLVNKLARSPGGYYLARYESQVNGRFVRLLDRVDEPGTLQRKYRYSGLARLMRAVWACTPQQVCGGTVGKPCNEGHPDCHSQGWIPNGIVAKAGDDSVQMNIPDGVDLDLGM